HLVGMAADAALARLADRGVRGVGLLHHRADEARELGHGATQDRLPERDVAEHAVARVGERVVRRGPEQRAGGFGSVGRRRDREPLLALEVVEETALAQARGFADVVDPGGAVALGADDEERGVEEPGAGITMDRGRGWIHGRGPYRPVGMVSTR